MAFTNSDGDTRSAENAVSGSSSSTVVFMRRLSWRPFGCQRLLPALDNLHTPANIRALCSTSASFVTSPDQVKQRLAHRSGDFASLVDEVLAIDSQRRAAETERQKLQSDRNRISKEIGIAKKNGQDTSAIEAEVRGIGSRIDEIGREADIADTQQRDLLLSIPNLPHEACPVGQTAEENPEVRVWGTKPELQLQSEGSHRPGRCSGHARL
jgi:hypothetical protein